MTAALRLGGIKVGDELPAPEIALTIQKLVMIAAANRDFAPIHHDADVARQTGAPTAYGNMMFVMAMIERAVLGWAGPSARLRRLTDVRMRAFNCAGDTIRCGGTVIALDRGAGQVEVDVWLRAGERLTATARATVQFSG